MVGTREAKTRILITVAYVIVPVCLIVTAVCAITLADRLTNNAEVIQRSEEYQRSVEVDI